MKIRSGFVTNSSSSSFILSKNYTKTIDDVFIMIRDIYRQLPLKAHEAFKELVTKGIYKPGDNYLNLYRTNNSIKVKVDRTLDNYDISIYDLIYMVTYDAPGWCVCNTYEEYLNYNGSSKDDKPFTIIDLNNINEKHDIEEASELVDWYASEEAREKISSFKTDLKCNECEYYAICDHSTLDGCKSDIESQEIYCYSMSNINKFIVLDIAADLGSYAIYGAENSIPLFIMDRLKPLSSMHCSHMG